MPNARWLAIENVVIVDFRPRYRGKSTKGMICDTCAGCGRVIWAQELPPEAMIKTIKWAQRWVPRRTAS